jgi:hypothetical protein
METGGDMPAVISSFKIRTLGHYFHYSPKLKFIEDKFKWKKFNGSNWDNLYHGPMGFLTPHTSIEFLCINTLVQKI